MQALKLTPTSFMVLGLLEQAAPAEATPYDIKQWMGFSVDNFWPTPHAQVYREPERLATGGYVTERREETGRRRKFYKITEAGSAALETWRHEPLDDLPELRDAAVLKIFFGADPVVVARHQVAAHEAKLAEYEHLRSNIAEFIPPGQLLALDIGIAHERKEVDLWNEVAAGQVPPTTSAPRA
ncbi:PadR family transcriptional regulator [Conexibacter woesei]|uniref:PadR family transcriptional regulator n=1 Tax=Conexibacter woesei TaxID=191495 RepID=UPI0004140643|nr:PadR family transcriptional regulator [Conexibacter woesei]